MFSRNRSKVSSRIFYLSGFLLLGLTVSNCGRGPHTVFIAPGIECEFPISEDCTPITGNMGGVEGADAICQWYADQHSLSGTYKAWISNDTLRFSPSGRRFSHRYNQPYVLPNGVRLWDNWSNVIDDLPDAPINVYPNGETIEQSIMVWTNTWRDGTPVYDDDPDTNYHCCNEWSTDSATAFGLGGIACDIEDSTDPSFCLSHWTDLHAPAPISACDGDVWAAGFDPDRIIPRAGLYCFEQW